ncbi:SDR family NAD(P)-dependent oxidoreductase [Phenylobacterium sp. LjRoot219]|uniref:SDR family oxidoreductase n=1 Tax=Phenylobacterium sp. LjRoot219 TaxID=3342283 RepID=UPI003ED080EF
MANHVEGKSIIVTGAGNGFGRLASERLAALGGRLVCADIKLEAAEQVAAGIRAAGGVAIAVKVDVSDIAEMRALAAAALEAHGAIDVMVNNAGVMPLAFIAEHAAALDAWSRCIDINFKGMMNGVAAVYDQMMAQGHGHVVNLSSIYGNSPAAGAAVYGATKAAVDYFSHALRQEARGKIKVTVVKPTGVIATGLAATVVNPAAGGGILGQNVAAFYEAYGRIKAGDAPREWVDQESIEYASLAPEHLADAIVHVIDQPWGVSISDITVRASGDHYIF